MKKYINILLVLIWFIIIFLFSNMNTTNSNGLSKKVVSYSVTIAVKVSNKLNITDITLTPQRLDHIILVLNYPIRKVAHATVYMVLALIIIHVLRSFSLKKNISVIITVLACFIYSLTDEYHQRFIPGRTGQFSDCLIDTFGAIIGVLIYLIVIKIINKIKKVITNKKSK